jgi:hypothetical protein
MTYPVTGTDLVPLREEIRELRQKNYALDAQVQKLQWVHDTDITILIEERRRREAASMIRLMIFWGILCAVNVILILLPTS